MKVVFTDTALSDLDSIYYYREELSAKRLVRAILDEIKVLEIYPEAAPVDDLFADLAEIIRSLVVAKGWYKVLYFTENDFIYISRIWDCRQNPKTLKSKIKK
jgi:plasmid stabilization system protein ParE